MKMTNLALQNTEKCDSNPVLSIGWVFDHVSSKATFTESDIIIESLVIGVIQKIQNFCAQPIFASRSLVIYSS